jgi:hypothetical protein
MSVNIGNGNKIRNSNIAEKIENHTDPVSNRKQTFFERHPVICSFLISLIAGIVLLFSFWGKNAPS